MNKLVSIACLFLGLLNSIVAQTQLQYELNQQGIGSCAGSTITLSVSTSVRITTTAVTEITSNAATTGGNITNDGGNLVTQRGVCWSTSPNPTTIDNITNNGNGLGSFTSNLSGLLSSTTYYLRAYAINSVGIFYGNEVVVTTPNIGSPSPHSCGAENVHNPNLNYGTMTDQDGNVYKTIVIGDQEWMAENLKVSHYRNGDLIPNISDNEEWASGITSGFTTGASCWYNNDSASYDCPYGKLYNYFAVADSRNLCPSGWHVPTDAEWNELLIYLDSTYGPIETSGFQAGIGGGVMQSIGTYYWQYPNQLSTNSSGFSGLPSGVRIGDFYGGLGTNGHWWSSTLIDVENAWYTYLTNYNSVGSGPYRYRSGYSVRCLKDAENSIDCGSATNSGTLIQGLAANGLTISVPYIGGNGGNYEAQIITSTGVTGLTANLIAGNFATGAGSLTYTITGTPATSGAASFALSISGQTCTLNITVYSIGQSGITSHSCGAENMHNPAKVYSNMTDQDGNNYKTILIGNQEWMAENLKAIHYRNGDLIPNVTDNAAWGSLSSGAWCHFNNDPQFECPYGKLYNWYTVVDSRNVCPAGWHIPSDSEWTTLTDYLGGVAISSGKMKTAGTQYWLSPNTNATNESGFSGLSGGIRNSFSGGYSDVGSYGFWWSSSESSATFALSRYLNYYFGITVGSSYDKSFGFSVRCLKD
jgi:uncharacterized protein (TIGR02145 family)